MNGINELLESGLRYYCDPNQPSGKCKWMRPIEKEDAHPDWVDTTDMSATEFEAFLLGQTPLPPVLYVYEHSHDVAMLRAAGVDPVDAALRSSAAPIAPSDEIERFRAAIKNARTIRITVTLES